MADDFRIILNLHGLGDCSRDFDPGEADLWVDVGFFEALLDHVAHRGHVRITFDDGNASDVSIALPALTARGMKAEFFVSTGKLGKSGYLDDEGVRALAAAGMGIGSHGVEHRAWRGLDTDVLRNEVVGSKERLEEILGCAVERAACPFGAYDRRVLDALSAAGYRRAYTSDAFPARASAWLQPRFSLRSRHDLGDVERFATQRSAAAATWVSRAKAFVKRLR